MGMIKGQKEYLKFRKGEFLTRKEAMLANCYMCNGLEESASDCLGTMCPIYAYRPYKHAKRVSRSGEAIKVASPG